MKEKISHILYRTAKVLSHAYAILMPTILVLAVHNYFIDIQDFKSRLFLFLSAGYVILEVVILTLLFLFDRQCFITMRRRFENKVQMIFVLLFGAALLGGWGFSRWPREAALGSMGRGLGAVHLLLCVMAFILLAITFEINRAGIFIFCTVTAMEIGIGIFNLWGLDPLRMYANLVDEQHAFFIGTVGNKNVTSNYLCLVLPVIVLLFLRSERTVVRRLLSVLIFASFYYGIGVSSDSFMMGMAALFLLLLWYCLSEQGRMKLFLQFFGLFYGASWAILLSLKIHPATPFFAAFPADGLIGMWMQPVCLAVAGVIVAVLAALAFRNRAVDGMEIKKLRKVRNILFALLGVGALLLLVFVTVVNLLPATSRSGLPAALQRLYIEDTFGSNRGYIWKKTIEAFAGLPVLNQVFGIGADCFYLHMVPLYGNEMTILFGAPFADAHNEFLQFMLTTGLLGAIGYFGIFISGCFQRQKEGGIAPLLFIVVPYIAQGMVNNPNIVSTPLLFIIAGLCMNGPASKSINSLNRKGDGQRVA